MSATQHPSMHHFTSDEAYRDFVEALAETEADAIHEWGAYEVASNIIAYVDDRSVDIQVGGGSAPAVAGVDAPLCPITVLEYSQATSGLPRDEVEHISHLAAELLEQDLQQQIKTDQHPPN